MARDCVDHAREWEAEQYLRLLEKEAGQVSTSDNSWVAMAAQHNRAEAARYEATLAVAFGFATRRDR